MIRKYGEMAPANLNASFWSGARSIWKIWIKIIFSFFPPGKNVLCFNKRGEDAVVKFATDSGLLAGHVSGVPPPRL